MLYAFIAALVPYIVVVDPICAAPLYISITSGYPPGKRRAVALDAFLAATLILISFAVFGGLILDYFGISLEALEIGGGTLMLMMALEMVKEGEKPRGKKRTAEEIGEAAIVPLAIPLLAGPGAITLTMIMVEKYGLVPVILAILAVMLLTLVILLTAERTLRLLGVKGAMALTRVAGLLLAALAVQYILEGITGWYLTHMA